MPNIIQSDMPEGAAFDSPGDTAGGGHSGKEPPMQTERVPAVGLTCLFGKCCFTCTYWVGKRRKSAAYCNRLNLSGKDAPRGDAGCILWEKRANARLSNKAILDGRKGEMG